jgi:hypothetical protein
MATELPLPKPSELPEGVLFHRDHPSDDRIVMQLPNADRTDAETWVLRPSKFEHSAWLGALKNTRELQDMLTLEQHVAYCPSTGHCEAVADIDTPSPTAMLIACARFMADRTVAPSIENYFVRRRAGERGRSPMVSTLRLALGGGRYLNQ